MDPNAGPWGLVSLLGMAFLCMLLPIGVSIALFFIIKERRGR